MTPDLDRYKYAKYGVLRTQKPAVYIEGLKPEHTYYPRTRELSIRQYINLVKATPHILKRKSTKTAEALNFKMLGYVAFNEVELQKTEAFLKHLINVAQETIIEIREIRRVNIQGDT